MKDLIYATNKHNEFDGFIREHFTEEYFRLLVENRVVSYNIYRKLESINIYDDFDDKFVGEYSVTIKDDDDMFQASGRGDSNTYGELAIYLQGYRWMEDCSGKQDMNKPHNELKIIVKELLNSIANDFINDTITNYH